MDDLDFRTVQELLAVRARLQKVLDRALMPPSPATFLSGGRDHEPAVDVWESDRDIVVEAELPDTRADDVELRLEGDTLVVAGTMGRGTECDTRHLRMERPRGAFRRLVPLPAATVGEPTASLKRGILQVRIEKAGRHTIAVRKDPA